MADSTCIDEVGPLSELHVQNVSLVRGERVVQRGLDFRVAAGNSLAVMGSNGAGKTSLLRAIAGLLEPASGKIAIRLNGGRVFSVGDERSQFVGWVGHNDAVKPQLTPAEDLNFHMRYLRRRDNIEEALERSGLAGMRDVPAQYLSAGQQRRVALARLVLAARPLWLLDEPLSSLDRHGKRLVRDLIANHCADGGIVVAATHEPIEAETQTIDLG